MKRGRDVFWIASFKIRGEEVVTMFDQKDADLARSLALNPKLVDRLDRRTDDTTLSAQGNDPRDIRGELWHRTSVDQGGQ